MKDFLTVYAVNIEDRINQGLKSSVYTDSYMVGTFNHERRGDIEILAFKSKSPIMTGPFIRYHIAVYYFYETLYYDSNVIGENNPLPSFDEIAARAQNYLNHRAQKVAEQYPKQ